MSTTWQWHELEEHVDGDFLSGASHKQIRLYADANIPIEVVRELRGSGISIISAWEEGNETKPDQFHFHEASRQGRVLLTADQGFWNDRKYPLQHSSGVILVVVKPLNVEKILYALAYLWVLMARYWPGDWWNRMKVKARESSFSWKMLTCEGKIEEQEYKVEDGKVWERRIR